LESLRLIHDDLAHTAVLAFEKVVASTVGFRPRAGQHAMAEQVAHTLAQADLGDDVPNPNSAIAVIQAGTGVGKSAAYAAPAISMALERQTRVLISTATVALQEQLMTKDLPALAASMDTPFTFALAKGRARYVCKVKLERLAGSGAADDNLFDAEEWIGATRSGANQTQAAAEERRFVLYENLAHLLGKDQWNGDRDTLADPPEPGDWAAIAAERHTCTVRHCPRFRDCSYYQARSRLVEANVIVANHDLVLASLGSKTLPDLDNCLVIFDEGHHLPAVALDQFSSSMDVSNLRWLDRLPKILQDVSSSLQLQLGQDVDTISSQLKGALTQLARMALDMVHTSTDGKDGILRFANGQLPEQLTDTVTQIYNQAQGLSKTVDALGAEVKLLAKEDPPLALRCAQQFAKMGALAPRLASVISTSQLLLEHGPQPLAKWLQANSEFNYLVLSAHACPIVPGDLLRQFLWSQVRAGVVTSATLASCGSFDYFLQEAGLADNHRAQTLEVSSPFNYATQGTLTVVQTRADPKNAAAYTAEMVDVLIEDIAQVQRGALVLFTSKAQMRAATDKLPGHLQDMVLVQGTTARAKLLASHSARIQAGYPSVLFGLQSFGEGLDLPGALCETVFITKLPFTPPSDPVDEARAEWMRSVGRDPFNELVIPATGIKLLQWTGRAIRTEDDIAHVICYDKRLLLQSYGKRLLAGLPPYKLERRVL
jgi:ATP-dependent DNA helicase DinG